MQPQLNTARDAGLGLRPFQCLLKSLTIKQETKREGEEMITVNGKDYPLWSQFVEGKEKWIGGTLVDMDMGMEATTKITDVTLKPNGEESAMFHVEGEDFTCGFDVGHGGISGSGEKGWLTFHGYGGHTWKIKETPQPD